MPLITLGIARCRNNLHGLLHVLCLLCGQRFVCEVKLRVNTTDASAT